jgi:hypothetical protein
MGVMTRGHHWNQGSVTDDDVKWFAGIEKGITIIMCPVDRSKDIADPQQQVPFDEIKLYLECVN